MSPSRQLNCFQRPDASLVLPVANMQPLISNWSKVTWSPVSNLWCDDITGPHGEHFWSKQYPFCGGAFQSPIDIQTDLLRFDPTLRPIEVRNYNLSTDEQLTLGNNGHSGEWKLLMMLHAFSKPVHIHSRWSCSGTQCNGKSVIKTSWQSVS